MLTNQFLDSMPLRKQVVINAHNYDLIEVILILQRKLWEYILNLYNSYKKVPLECK